MSGFFLLPNTELLIRDVDRVDPLSPQKTLRYLGMQVAFVLPVSMPAARCGAYRDIARLARMTPRRVTSPLSRNSRKNRF
ncbi:MAG TPA: hypothetical protein VJO52_00565 [Gemmatimonadaceae bacterium]|nr:hypothetical protein [Gemmatimonadaceae bacterium]